MTCLYGYCSQSFLLVGVSHRFHSRFFGTDAMVVWAFRGLDLTLTLIIVGSFLVEFCQVSWPYSCYWSKHALDSMVFACIFPILIILWSETAFSHHWYLTSHLAPKYQAFWLGIKASNKDSFIFRFIHRNKVLDNFCLIE